MPPINPNESIEQYAFRSGVLSNGRPYSAPEIQSAIDQITRLVDNGSIMRLLDGPGLPQDLGAFPPSIPTSREPIEMSWRTARNSPRVGGARFNVAHQVWERLEEKQEPKAMDKETEQRLHTAMQKVEKELTVLRNQIPRERVGRREGEYKSLIIRSKRERMTAREILSSEIPVQLGSVEREKYMEIARMGYCSDIWEERNEHGEKRFLRCATCRLDMPNMNYAYLCNGHLYCAEHVPSLSMCSVCRHLRPNCKEVKTFDKRKVVACTQCLDSRNYCQRCEKHIAQEYFEVRLCGKCINIPSTQRPFREFSMGTKWVSEDKGKIYKSDRMFSCELEAMSANADYADILSKNLPKEMGIGQDGSVGVRGQSPWGFEVQTPRLQGAKGEELIERAIAGVKLVEPVLDETCGMHIHLDGKGIIENNRKAYPQALIQLLKAYTVFEDVIVSFLPYSRRGNDYCRLLSTAFQFEELDALETTQDVERLWYKEQGSSEIRSAKGHHYHSSRYFGANLHSLFVGGHFEVRFHSGTLNARKVLEWANFHALLLDACMRGEITNGFIKEYTATSRITERTHLLFERIGMAKSSVEYFRQRQSKFGDKKNDEDEVKQSGRKVNTPPRVSRPQVENFAWTGRIEPLTITSDFADAVLRGGIIAGSAETIVPTSTTSAAPTAIIDDESDLWDDPEADA